eukprot:scaffold823_cov219-Amphora_coffeaeformis.AAC.11
MPPNAEPATEEPHPVDGSRTLPLPSQEEWTAKVHASVGLVTKMINILRSRGLPPAAENVDFGPVEDYLGCELPADYKELVRNLPAKSTAWGLDPFFLFGPEEMLQEMKQLKSICHSREDYQGISMKPTDPVSFVPFGNSTSAFYTGWVKTHNHYDKHPWELVVLDSKNHFEFEPGEGMYRPLVEVLYRMVVRAVTPEVWATRAGGGAYRASYFWHSEDESDEADLGITRYARDGSQDISASQPDRLVVLGRPVCFLGGSDPDDLRMEDTSHLERRSCFEGCSEADFMGVGQYNIEHPIDVEVAVQEKRLREAPREDAVVSLHDVDTMADDSWTLVTDDTLRRGLNKATVLRRRIAVGDRWAAFIGINGHLAMVDTSNQHLWWNSTANNMLKENEIFTQVDIMGYHTLALTSTGRILTIRGYPPTYSWKSFDKLRKAVPQFAMNFVKVSAGENSAAALTSEGRIVYWGSVTSTKGGITRVTVQEPFFVPNMSKIVDINLMGRGLCILHSSGRVSLITKRDGLRIIDASHKIVAVHAAGDHVLMLNSQGAVYGLGDRAVGQLPVAVTKEIVRDHDHAVGQYNQAMARFDEKLKAYRQTIVEHAKTNCTKHRLSDKDFQDDWAPVIEQGICIDMSRAGVVKGILHSPEVCGAPALPDELKTSPRPPVHPTEESGHAPLKDPTLLTVGEAHEAALESDDTVSLPPEAWNSVTGPYGCTPGSKAKVVAVSGTNLCTVFLHADGTLSSCGDGKPLCTGLVPPGAPRSNGSYSIRQWGSIGIPLQVEPLHPPEEEPPKFVAVAVGRAGTLAVQDNGQIWGCGDSVGTSFSSELLEKLIVLR